MIDKIGYGRIFPKQADKWNTASSEEKGALMAKAVTVLGGDLKVDSAPASTVIRVSYANPDPQMAALILNTLIEQYLSYRRQVLVGASAPVTLSERRLFEDQLAQADASLQAFLVQNDIGDFEAKRLSLNGLETSLTDERYRVQARLREAGGRLAELGRQAVRVPAEIGLYQDSNAAASDKLLALKLEREDLLGRYKPGAQPVRDIDLKIAQVQRMIAEGRGAALGASRTGINPLYQTVQTEQLQLSAETASLRERLAALTSQLAQVTGDRLKLAAVEPRYQDLLRNRDILSANVRDLTAKAQADDASRAIGGGGSDTIRVVERAAPPAKGKSLRKPVAILAFLFAGFTALCLGLLRVFLRSDVPTASSAARTFDLPVLATAGFKPARS